MQEWSYNYSGTCITPQDVYLAHHGVKGMKWGVRHDRKKAYGMSKHKLKKSIKNAKKAYRKNSGDPYYFSGYTGNNVKKTYDKYKSEMQHDKTNKDLKSKSNAYYKKAEKYYNNGKYDLSDKYQKMGDKYNSSSLKRETDIYKKYDNQFKESILKDIGYTDIYKGKNMLNDYGIKVDKNGRVK